MLSKLVQIRFLGRASIAAGGSSEVCCIVLLLLNFSCKYFSFNSGIIYYYHVSNEDKMICKHAIANIREVSTVIIVPCLSFTFQECNDMQVGNGHHTTIKLCA